jgi:hypothetical protein
MNPQQEGGQTQEGALPWSQDLKLLLGSVEMGVVSPRKWFCVINSQELGYVSGRVSF